jgi:hypothetical protein
MENVLNSLRQTFHIESYGFQNFIFYCVVIFVGFLVVRWMIMRPLAKSIYRLDRDSIQKSKWMYLKKLWWPWLLLVFPAIALAAVVLTQKTVLTQLFPVAFWLIISISLLVLSVIIHLTMMANCTITVLRQKAISQNPS